jgi:ribosomal protein L37AE/L43A
MNTNDSPTGFVCPRCRSTETIRLDTGFTHEAWHCYRCRRSFDRLIAQPHDQPFKRANRYRRKTDLPNKG